MPSLNQYAESTDNQGVYVRANAGGSTPVTLQVSDLAERIFVLLDYHPPDTVPNKLIWSMYEVGLLYTLNALGELKNSDGATTVLDQLDLDNSLLPDQKAEIIAELETYRGPNVDEVEKLIDRLDGQYDPAEIDRSYSEGGSLALLERWADDPEKVTTLLESVDMFADYATASIKTFAKHPYLSAPPIWTQGNGSIKYQVDKENQSNEVYIYDHRFMTDYDFKIVLDRSGDRREVAEVSKHRAILDYRNEAGAIGAIVNISGLVNWVIPDEKITVEIPESSKLYSSLIKEYEGEEAEPIRVPSRVDRSKVRAVEVDRISGGDNPVADPEDLHHLVLDQGQPGERFVVEIVNNHRARVLSRLPPS